MTNHFIVKNLKTHTLHSHWTGVYVTDKPQQLYMATQSVWFPQKAHKFTRQGPLGQQ